jgi:hypothetical protein
MPSVATIISVFHGAESKFGSERFPADRPDVEDGYNRFVIRWRFVT